MSYSVFDICLEFAFVGQISKLQTSSVFAVPGCKGDELLILSDYTGLICFCPVKSSLL